MMDWKGVTAAIYGCMGEKLTAEEEQFFRKNNPYGFILFARNCTTRDQVRALTAQLRACVERDDVPILIDQEGGRVCRLTAPEWRSTPAAGVFAELALSDLEAAKEAVYMNARLIAHDLREIGVNVDCAPMLDVAADNAHDIIGDRAFGAEPTQVAALGQAMADGLLDGGVMPVIKHIPGHGRATADSHEELPVVTASRKELEQDFAPFKALSHLPYAMTAHVRYTALDKVNVATLSADIIQMIRDEIGFSGVLMSDDLSMKALQGSFAMRAKASLQAGCDVLLHCNGDMAEMEEISEHVPMLAMDTIKRLERITHYLKRDSLPIEPAAAEDRLQQLLHRQRAA